MCRLKGTQELPAWFAAAAALYSVSAARTRQLADGSKLTFYVLELLDIVRVELEDGLFVLATLKPIDLLDGDARRPREALDQLACVDHRLLLGVGALFSPDELDLDRDIGQARGLEPHVVDQPRFGLGRVVGQVRAAAAQQRPRLGLLGKVLGHALGREGRPCRDAGARTGDVSRGRVGLFELCSIEPERAWGELLDADVEAAAPALRALRRYFGV